METIELIEGAVTRRARKPWQCEGNGAATPRHDPACGNGRIQPGDLYVEYLGESAAYESGSRHSLPCARAFYGVAN